MDDADRDALLIRLDERTLRADKALYGNGRQGIIADVASLRSDLDDLDTRAPSSTEKRAGWAAITTAFIVAVGGAVVEWLKQ